MAEFLASCNESVPLDKFDELSNKRLIDLVEENSGREVEIYRDPKTGRAIREAKSVRAIIRNPAEKKQLLEMSRTYLNGKTIPNYPGYPSVIPFEVWSISETQKLNEAPLDCLKRGLDEELKIKAENIFESKVSPLRFTPTDYRAQFIIKNPAKGLESKLWTPDDIHKSSAYAGVWSRVVITWFIVSTYQLSEKIPLPTKRDSGVIINREWIDDFSSFSP